MGLPPFITSLGEKKKRKQTETILTDARGEGFHLLVVGLDQLQNVRLLVLDVVQWLPGLVLVSSSNLHIFISYFCICICNFICICCPVPPRLYLILFICTFICICTLNCTLICTCILFVFVFACFFDVVSIRIVQLMLMLFRLGQFS